MHNNCWNIRRSRKMYYEPLTFEGQKQIKEDDRWIKKRLRLDADPEKSAVIICDMWNTHWCKGAAARVDELAAPIEKFTSYMRRNGFLIVHCPSNTMAYYADNPARKRALEAPPQEADPPLLDWCPLDPEREDPLPFDDSDGGCFCKERCTYSRPYYGEHERITIDPDRDIIVDDRLAYDFFRTHGIDTVFYCGVHANICVPGRPFGIRQMVRQGIRCILVRDLIDVMYNPAMPPYMDHFDAVDAMSGHLERFWCCSTTTADIMGGFPFRFREDYRLF